MDRSYERKAQHNELLVVEADTPDDPTVVAHNRAFIVNKVLGNPVVLALGRNNKLSAAQTAIGSIAIAITLEELDHQNRNYLAAESGFLTGVFARLFLGASKPVQGTEEAGEGPTAIPPRSSLWDKVGWGGISAILGLTLIGAAFYAQRAAQAGPAWQSTADAYKGQVTLLTSQLNDANTKRDEYADKLLELNRYVGTIEGQASAQTAEQKATAQKLLDILGKVDDIQKSQHPAGTPIKR
jgi:hypothetical protein